MKLEYEEKADITNAILKLLDIQNPINCESAFSILEITAKHYEINLKKAYLNKIEKLIERHAK